MKFALIHVDRRTWQLISDFVALGGTAWNVSSEMLLVRVPDSQLNEPCPESAESSSQPRVLFITVDFYTATHLGQGNRFPLYLLLAFGSSPSVANQAKTTLGNNPKAKIKYRNHSGSLKSQISSCSKPPDWLKNSVILLHNWYRGSSPEVKRS